MIVSTPQSREDVELEHAHEAMLTRTKQEHNLALAKLKYSTRPRATARQTILVTLFKAPAYPIAILAIMVLLLAEKPIPPSLEQFINR